MSQKVVTILQVFVVYRVALNLKIAAVQSREYLIPTVKPGTVRQVNVFQEEEPS